MNLKLITPPTVEPIDINTAKTFLRVDVSVDDTLITSLLKSAAEGRGRADGR